MNVSEFLEKTNPIAPMFPRPRVFCKDGFSISIQAGQYIYSDPRYIVSGHLYKEVELGFPSEVDDLITRYAEDAEDIEYTETVYPYTPIDVVDKLLEKHGGIEFYGWRAS